MPAGPRFTTTLISWLGLGLVAFLSIWFLRPPEPVPATAPPAEFSAERALQHVKAIAKSPRPIGSAGHAAAREYIFQELQALSLEPEIQKTTAVGSTAAPLFVAGTIQNIVARKKGNGNGGAVLLVAHYDSVPTGPGANDDGVGVATLLETARALSTSGPLLKNDVIFLFTDSEETGLLGARAFVAEHPWAKEVGVALNFEARGNGGPVIMFETSPQNSALIRAFAKAAPYPLANSLSYEIYKRLPNDTDMTVFKGGGLSGMNFAYISGLTHYHTQLDNLENVDERTLQHHGSYALALSRHFGADVSGAKPEGDMIYFNAFAFLLVRYPAWLAWPLTFGALLLFGAVMRLGFRRRELTWGGIAKGALLFFLTLITVAAAVWSAWSIVRRIHPAEGLILQGDSYNHGLYVLGFAALTLAVTTATLGSLGKRISEANLFVGALVWWCALMVAATLLVAGGSYLLTWPFLFALVGLGYAFTRPDERSGSVARIVIATLCAVPGMLLVVPMFHLTFVAMPFALAPALVLLLVLMAGLLIPLIRSSTFENRWAFPAGAAAMAIVFFALAGMRSGFDKNRRQSNHVLYLLDAAAQRARWLSLDARPDEWTEQFFGKNPERGPLENSFPLGRRPYLQSAAPSAPLEPPELQVLEDEAANDVRRLRFRLVSPRGAERLSVQITCAILSVAVEGKRLTSNAPSSTPETRCSFLYVGLPKEGIELVLETRATSPVAMRLVDESYGLPALDGAPPTSRPAHMMPAPFFRSDFSLVSRDFSF